MLRFTWPGQPGQRFVLQVAADSRFQYIVEERHADRPAVDIARPLHGVYFARLRTTERDGTVAPFSDAIRFEIPEKEPGAKCAVAGERGLCAVYAPTASPPR